MKASSLFLAALLGLSVSGAACAQTTVPGAMVTPGATMAPGTTAGTVPNASLPGSIAPAGATPIGTAPGAIYTPGSTTGTLNGTDTGPLNSTQPVPAGASPATRSTRRTTTGSRATTRP